MISLFLHLLLLTDRSVAQAWAEYRRKHFWGFHFILFPFLCDTESKVQPVPMYLCLFRWVSFYQRKPPPVVSRRDAAIAWSSHSVCRKEMCYVLIPFHECKFENRQVFPGPMELSCQPLFSVGIMSPATASEAIHLSAPRHSTLIIEP